MSKKNQHVVPSGKDWAVRGEGNDRKTAIVDTQAEQEGKLFSRLALVLLVLCTSLVSLALEI